ncbi:MAG: 23S rRNA (adenine(2503)-C(2))-methyltransferase RlmN [Abditibacteriota bacterium]|nr:23S rRNA (adenine(2503)-C(2))-methyltransferase RlmN [Abditibacteriota bacterium]
MELTGLTGKEIIKYCVDCGEKPFRGSQIINRVYKQNAASWDEMTELPKGFRESISQVIDFHAPEIVEKRTSPDKAVKYLLRLRDGETIETVLLPYAHRVSLCVSTQVGCPCNCAFCATGAGGFVRNLSAGEIVSQVLTVQRDSGLRISHIVFMGMGEGLLNYDNLLKAVSILNEDVGIAMRRITVSTVGVVPEIYKLAKEKLQLNLALSLHAPTDEIRRKIIPFARKHTIAEIAEACNHYTTTTGRRLTVEYLLLAGINDSDFCAHELAKLVKKLFATVNIIPYNPVPGKSFKRPERERIFRFKGVVSSYGVEVVQRMERGSKVAGACGQLRGQSKNGRRKN